MSLAAAALLALAAPLPAQPGQPADDAATVARDGNAFALELYGQLARRDGNLFFSPYSLSSALGMTYAGARGKTAQDMARTLHFSLPADRLAAAQGELGRALRGGKGRPYQLTVANALWAQRGFSFLPAFTQATQAHYGAGLHQVDFRGATEAARQTINRWVENETQQKIQDLLPDGVLDPDTRLVLTNAIYFKAAWANPFPARATKPEDFALASGKRVAVPMMHQVKRYGVVETDTFQVLDLPYQQHDLSMVIVLPRRANGLPAVEREATAERLRELLNKRRPAEVVLSLPKFKMTRQFQLKDVLSGMGMASAFGRTADFSGMSTEDRLHIQDVIHKAFIDVDEKGTEAAAATAVVVGVRTAALPGQAERVVFRADHPFLFVIRENRTGVILFAGRVENPTR